jgi:hypothetical protein
MREQIVREDTENVVKEKEENEQEKATIDTKPQALLAKKAELEQPSKPAEPKLEPVEETVASSVWWGNFVAPIGFHLEGEYLVQDDEEPVAKNIEYELEYN